MSKKRQTKISMTKNTNDYNRSFATVIKFIDQMSDDEVDKCFK